MFKAIVIMCQRFYIPLGGAIFTGMGKKMKSCIHFIAKTQHHVLQAPAGENEQFMAALHDVHFLSELTDLQR